MLLPVLMARENRCPDPTNAGRARRAEQWRRCPADEHKQRRRRRLRQAASAPGACRTSPTSDRRHRPGRAAERARKALEWPPALAMSNVATSISFFARKLTARIARSDTSVRRLRYLWVGLRSARASHESFVSPRPVALDTGGCGRRRGGARVAACSNAHRAAPAKDDGGDHDLNQRPGSPPSGEAPPGVQVVGNTLELSSGGAL